MLNILIARGDINNRQLFDSSKATPIAMRQVVDLTQLITGGHQ